MKQTTFAIRAVSASLLIYLICAFTPMGVIAGTSLKVNSARVDTDAKTLTVDGLNFPTDGSLEVTVGDTFIEGCTISEVTVVCSLDGTPALSTGGSWSVQLSAGNSPNANTSIDVYMQVSSTSECNTGDYVQCYPGDGTEIGVGICQSGTRSCGLAGAFEECVGYQSPQEEWPSHCDDGQDNDCNGVIDDGCDVLEESPTEFVGSNSTELNASFTVPAGITELQVALWGAGGGGAGATDANDTPQEESISGGGGGSGGFIQTTIAVTPGDHFTVRIGSPGIGGQAGQPSQSGSNGSGATLTGTNNTLIASGGQGAQGASGGSSGTGGTDGANGEMCDLTQTIGADDTGSAAPGLGGVATEYNGFQVGAGGSGGELTLCGDVEDFLCGVTGECWVYSKGEDGVQGEPGGVVIWWSAPGG